jgi:transposase, IS5 family
MRKVKEPQLQIGQVRIEKIVIDPSSRDDIPKLLLGLQQLYHNEDLRQQLLERLSALLPPGAAAQTGRPGMELWRMFVLGVLRTGAGLDYDRLQELANEHATLRQMLGHGMLDRNQRYPLQTIKDNVSRFTPELAAELNELVVRGGYAVLGKDLGQGLQGRADSFVVETNVHYPTDLTLAMDALRVGIRRIARASRQAGLAGWRQSKCLIRRLKQLVRRMTKMKRSTSSDETKKQQQLKALKKVCREFLAASQAYLARMATSMQELQARELADPNLLSLVASMSGKAAKLLDQIARRVLRDEKIPHDEKEFSVFQRHTEWISKGKAGVPQELGLRVAIVADQHQFILHHRVMKGENDVDVAVHVVKDAQAAFPELQSCSFDKGFHSPANQLALAQCLRQTTLPKKGKRNAAETERERSPEFVAARRSHSGVESVINGLEHHGLGRCPDHGLTGFRRHVALAVLAYNLHRLGALLQVQRRHREKRCAALRAARAGQVAV